MCTFNLTAMLCGCRDPQCKMRVEELKEERLQEVLEKPGGHILVLTSYYRVSGTCQGNFINPDPNRTVVRFGIREDQANSTQDCTNRELMYEEYSNMVMTRCAYVCSQCIRRCVQPAV